jgi:hypothetical protein
VILISFLHDLIHLMSSSYPELALRSADENLPPRQRLFPEGVAAKSRSAWLLGSSSRILYAGRRFPDSAGTGSVQLITRQPARTTMENP